jgi:SpoVK/Ycf46/Vps4 family AAA+-type ATPase
MTTNYITRLDEALIRPARVDMKVELGLADKKMTVDLFGVVCRIAQLDVLVGEDGKDPDAARTQEGEVKRVERLAEEFAAKAGLLIILVIPYNSENRLFYAIPPNTRF